MRVVNPATGIEGTDYQEPTQEEVEKKIALASKTFAAWSRTSFSDRSALMSNAARVLRDRQDQYARLMTEEMGKPISQSHSEVEKCAWVCEYYATSAEKILSKQFVESDDYALSYVRFDPLGPVLAVMPWNFPFWQVFRFAAPALMAGNVGLLKHASNVPGCALAIEEVFREAGFPDGAFTTLLISGGDTEQVICHPDVRAVTLTGSEKAGQKVAAAAGNQLKKTVLELGGSDPFIVLADADIAEAAAEGVKSRTINTGQSCIAAKRFIVEESIVDEFTEAFVRQMELLRTGDPTEANINMGPMAREDLRQDLHGQVNRSVESGAKRLLGGEYVEGNGFFYQPTVLGDVRPGMACFDEETFGPVAAIIAATDADNAVELANQSEYGLGASIWTKNQDRAEALAGRIDAGCVFINEFVKSDPRLPFGGVKKSGYGRELADFGIREFTNIKAVRAKKVAKDPVQEASEESFPASDPPAFTS